ncbi:MAG: substrate-binding domain-containing protein [Opitutaceae bacterium]
MKIPLFLLSALLLTSVTRRGDAALEDLPAYQPETQVTGTITSWGHVFMKDVMKKWERGFQKFQPGVRFSDNLVSSAAATGALFTGTADLGLVGREIRPMEVAGYNRVMKHKPYGIEVMTGSYADADKSLALAIFVQRDNPLAQLTYAQLDAVFGGELRQGAPARIRTWGQLGLTGAWANRPIHVYIGVPDAAPGFVFSQVVMKGSLLWNDEAKVFDDADLPGGKTLTSQQQIVDAVGADRDGIGLAGAGTRNPQAKLIAIAPRAGGPFLAPTPESVADRTYPLVRSVWIYVNHAPGQPIAPKVKEFLRYILSREGQADVAADGVYLPLTAAMVRAQLQRLQ